MIGELEITKRIRVIEELKCHLLSDVSGLYSEMLKEEADAPLDTLADIVIITYFLSDNLGISFDGLDLKIANKLKVSLINEKENSPWKSGLAKLYRHFSA